jgi:hypothetical protein
MATIHTIKGDINATNVVFNDKLKDFIGKAQVELNVAVNLHGHYFMNHLNEQKTIRNWFIENQYDGMLHSNKKIGRHENNQDFYALFLLLISPTDIYDNWNNVMSLVQKQIIINNGFSFDVSSNEMTREDAGVEICLENDVETSSNKIWFYCACGHHCGASNLWYIENKWTKLGLWIGGDCIKKYKIVDITALKTAKNERDTKLKTFKLYKNRIINKWGSLVAKYNNLCILPFREKGRQLLVNILRREKFRYNKISN